VLSVEGLLSMSVNCALLLQCQVLAVPKLVAISSKELNGPQMSVSFMACNSGPAGAMVTVRVAMSCPLQVFGLLAVSVTV
jgi:hypothetical protein